MSNGRAQKGGQTGLNGEWYDGGQFLPSSASTIKGACTVTIRKGTKKEVAPYTWEAAPADDMLSIYDRIGHFCNDNRRECQYIKGQGFVGFKLTEAHTEGPWNHIDENGRLAGEKFTQDWMNFAAGLIERFNNGERWYPLTDDPFHFKNQ